ncbi:MAG TPA: tetratricopeptide repeat protein, partial [Caulobacteraceae bacterium]
LDRQAKRETSTIKTALLASVTAVVLTGSAVGYWRLANGGDLFGFRPGQANATSGPAQGDALAASAVLTPPNLGSGEAATLYEEAVAKLDAGDASGVPLLTRAANLGHAPAQFHLARLYDAGESGVTADKAEARTWTQRAADGGEPRAMYNLGLYLFDGVGGPQDQPAAVRWFRQAAESGFVDSQYNLGRVYEQGAAGVPQNPVEAYRWYLIASEAGDAEAQAGAQRLGAALTAAQRAAAERDARAFTATAAG